jgi:hypothetical protein
VEELEADFHHFGTQGIDEELLERNVRLLADQPGGEDGVTVSETDDARRGWR